MSVEKRKKTYRNRFLALLILSVIFISLNPENSLAYTTTAAIYTPPNYAGFQPPAVGGSYTDPVFGTAVKRLSDAMHMTRNDIGGTLTNVSPEYSTMSPFNQDNSRLILGHFSYFGLYDGAGNYLRDLPLEINASSQPRWSRSDTNVLYYIYVNQLKSYNVGTAATAVVHTFTEYTTINGYGESDISFDGNHFVFAGNARYVFVYEIPTDSKGGVMDVAGHSFDSLYISPNNNVTITWNANGNGTRFTGIEMFDRNMNFQRQLAHAGGHMDMTRDINGDEILVWTDNADAWPQTNCNSGIVKIRLADGKQTCIWSGDWSMSFHVSAPDNSGWVFVENVVPSDPTPPTGWLPYTNEILQIKLDGSEVRRLVQHRSRPRNSYEYQPRSSVSRDGTKLVFTSNFNLQTILGYPSGYGDTYMIDLSTASPNSGGTAITGTPTTPPAPTPVPSPAPAPAPTPLPATTVARVEENGSGVTYTGTWSNNAGAFNSASGAKMSMDANSRVTLAFNGSGASWIGYQDEWSGIAQVYIDGTLAAEVDTYSTPAKAQSRVYTVSGLAQGAHTLAIQATGRKSAASAGLWVWVDAFDVTSTSTSPAPAPIPAPVPVPTGSLYRIEQSNPAVKWTGTWSPNNGAFNSGSSAKLSITAGSRATFAFTGTSVSWIAYRDEWSGIASVYIDGALTGTVDTYSSPAKAQTVAYTISGLTWGAHTIAIAATGTRSAASKAAWIWVDAFDYIGATLSAH